MNFNMIVGASCILAVAMAGEASASPPVQVEVLTGDGVDDPLFEGAPEEGTSKKSAKVKANPSTGAEDQNVNTNTQVVNVTIEGGTVKTDRTAERERTIKELEGDMAEARQRIREHKAQHHTSPTGVPGRSSPSDLSLEKKKAPKQNWWNAGTRIKKGDFLLTSRVGEFSGVGLGYMLTDRLALTLNAGFDKLKGEDESIDALNNARKDTRFFVPSVDGGQNVTSAWSWMIDLGATYHVVAWKYFGAYVGAGVSSFNYYLDEEGGDGVWGGSIYGRANTGLHWQWKRLFGGFDLAWYPYEVARYLPEEPGGEPDFVSLSRDQRKDSKRTVGTWFMGIRL